MNTNERMARVVAELRNSPLTDLQIAEAVLTDLDAAGLAIVPRNATEGMVKAAGAIMAHDKYHRDIYRAMIDDAIKEEHNT